MASILQNLLPKIDIFKTSILSTESKIDIEIEKLYLDTEDKENKIMLIIKNTANESNNTQDELRISRNKIKKVLWATAAISESLSKSVTIANNTAKKVININNR